MKIIAHRGLWRKADGKNTLEAFNQAFLNGYGIETDIRDFAGRLVISHNMATAQCPTLKELFHVYTSEKHNTMLALNVKSDGIQDALLELIEEYGIKNYFVFDMSVPEMVVYKRMQIPFFTRHSDIENECVLYDDAQGVWLDSFYEENWLTDLMVQKHIEDGKRICVISPEIHGFEPCSMWKMLKEKNDTENIMLCTDKPNEAEAYFNGKN